MLRTPTTPPPRLSDMAIVAGLVTFGLLALAGVLFVQPGSEALQRLGLLFGLLGTGTAALVALLKADQAATQTNGLLDARIQAAVHRANNARRSGDTPLTPEQLEAGETAPGQG